MITFLVVFIFLDLYIRKVIPKKEPRKKFKEQNEFIIALAYIFIPLLLLQNELVYLQFAPLTDTVLKIFTPLLVVKVTVFIMAASNLESLFQNLKKYQAD